MAGRLVRGGEAPDDVAGLGKALAAGKHGWRDELMMNTAAYSGLRWGELAALTADQVDSDGRVIAVDRKVVEVVEVAGHLYVETPKARKSEGDGAARGLNGSPVLRATVTSSSGSPGHEGIETEVLAGLGALPERWVAAAPDGGFPSSPNDPFAGVSGKEPRSGRLPARRVRRRWR